MKGLRSMIHRLFGTRHDDLVMTRKLELASKSLEVASSVAVHQGIERSLKDSVPSSLSEDAKTALGILLTKLEKEDHVGSIHNLPS